MRQLFIPCCLYCVPVSGGWTTTALIHCIHCLLAYLLSMKGNVYVVICLSSNHIFVVVYWWFWNCCESQSLKVLMFASFDVVLTFHIGPFLHLKWWCVYKQWFVAKSNLKCPCLSARKQEIIKVTEQLIEAINNGDFEAYTSVQVVYFTNTWNTCQMYNYHMSAFLLV